jgi:hypothetical protein
LPHESKNKKLNMKKAAINKQLNVIVKSDVSDKLKQNMDKLTLRTPMSAIIDEKTIDIYNTMQEKSYHKYDIG